MAKKDREKRSGSSDFDITVELPAEPVSEYMVSGPSGEFGVPSEEPVVKKDERRVRLVNLRNKTIVVSLEHDVYCAAIGRCVCSRRDVVRERRIERKSTAQAPRVERILIPQTINIGPKGSSGPLHEAVQRCADVRTKLINRPQKLRIVPA